MKYLFCILFTLPSFLGFAQGEKTFTREDIKKADGLDISYMEKWEYFELKEAIQGKVLVDHPAMTGCGTIATCSMTIVLTDKKEKIRVLDYCSNKKYNVGDIVAIRPTRVFKCSIPANLNVPKTGHKWEPWKDDLTILKTTWGEIVR